MLQRDIFGVKKETHQDNTMMSDYFLPTSAAGWGTVERFTTGFRGSLFRTPLPWCSVCGRQTRACRLPTPFVAKALPRLRELDRFCSEHGARFF
jgi:hypothetical protein